MMAELVVIIIITTTTIGSTALVRPDILKKLCLFVSLLGLRLPPTILNKDVEKSRIKQE
jgi:hypothetical protein